MHSSYAYSHKFLVTAVHRFLLRSAYPVKKRDKELAGQKYLLEWLAIGAASFNGQAKQTVLLRNAVGNIP
uniref:DUF4372 domain-containing protein n=1 Tax=Ascaris lumbricoides TaxID=6252 RepID=A0A0M3HQ74_ASCLU